MTDTPAQTLFDEWDERYHSFLDRLPAQRPNPAVVTEVTGRPAGTALDIGCGMGADAVWLATQGWDVTAIDVSRVALDRAAAHAAQAGVAVTWRRSRLEDLELPDGGFDRSTTCTRLFASTREASPLSGRSTVPRRLPLRMERLS